MPGIAIKPSVLKELQRQMNQELGAAHSYLALTLWCEDQHFKGFADYFRKQADEEREHAKKFTDHLAARGALPLVLAVPPPQTKFDALIEAARHAQSLERANTAGINQVYESALAEKDYAAQVFLHWFINEQVEEEKWADEMVDRVEQATCCGGVLDLDRHITRYLEAPKA